MLLTHHTLIDQTHLNVPAEDKEARSYSAMVAAKETLLLLTQFSSLKFGLDFSNYDTVMNNYSVKLGFKMLLTDTVIYFIIGFVLEACLIVISYLCNKIYSAFVRKSQKPGPLLNENTD